MKKLLVFLPFLIAGCGVIPVGGYSTDSVPAAVGRFAEGYADGVAAYQAPVYVPYCPPVYQQHGAVYTPGVANALSPFTYY